MDYEALRDQSLVELKSYMDSLPEKKGTILAYWVKDYVRFLNKEASFDPTSLIRYKRGSIVKAHLGFRVGSEEGGLHYAVVIDTQSTKSSRTVTIIPLTSVKPDTDTANLHTSKLYIGDEVFRLLNQKINLEISDTIKLQNSVKAQLAKAQEIKIDIYAEDAETKLEEQRRILDPLAQELSKLNQKVAHCKKMSQEIKKMKQGSIALIGQITTISKLRIYDPMYPSDTLSNIRLSNNTMDKLDAKLRELYTKNTENHDVIGIEP